MSEDDYRARLPAVGTPVEQLLREFSQPLLDELCKEPLAEPAYSLALGAHRALKTAWEARRMSERLAARAEQLAERAELALEQHIRGLLAALSDVPELRESIFDEGLRGALEPRGQGQVAEAKKLVERLGGAGSAGAARASLEISRAALALSARLAAAEGADTQVSEALTRERLAERFLRRQFRQTLGTLTALFNETPERLEAFSKRVPAELAQYRAIPVAPPPTDAAEAEEGSSRHE